LYLLFSFLPLASFAQGTITNENFETYTAGARLCTQAPAYWYTWNNGPGTAEDPFVTDSHAFGGNNSLLVSGSNDVLLSLNGKTSGRYEISFYILVPSGKTGFYGLLQQFSGSESNWGVQCFFDVNNQGNIKAAGDVVNFNYNPNQWIQVRNIVDMNSDHAEVYINHAMVYEWQWSTGLSGTFGPLKLDALNFFAWNAAQRQPLMYVDSIVYKELPAPGAPLNLVASVTGNDVSLLWDAPSDGSPAGYRIYRDNEVLVSDVISLSYIDTDVYPGTYSYMVKAIYGSGLSQPAGPVEAIITGGTDRKYVLLEIATGTWCTYCPGSAMAADDHIEHGDKVAVIEYHNNDDYSNTDSDHRNSYYNVPGFPTAYFDGIHSVIGGNMTQTMYPTYKPVYDKSIQKRSLFDLKMEVTDAGNSELEVSITASKLYAYTNNKLRLQLVLTETHIPEIWQTIMTEVNFVCRKMYPDYAGSLADFSTDSVLNFTYTIPVHESYNFNNCALIAFLQDNSTKEVLQAETIKFNSLGKDELQEISVSVYPNPASDRLFFTSDTPVTSVSVTDISGRIINVNNVSSGYIDVSLLKAGVYILSILTDKGTAVRKFSVRK